MDKEETALERPAAGMLSALNALQLRADAVRDQLQDLDDEKLKLLYQGLEGATSIAWQLQADIIAVLRSRARYGSNAIAEIAKFLELQSERRAHELAQIHDDILSVRPDFREMPLEKGHYLAALRAKGRGRDPIEVLDYAADNGLKVRQLSRYVDNIEATRGSVTKKFYTLEEFTPADKTEEEMFETPTQLQYFSPMARLVDVRGVRFLEVKESK